MNEELKVANEFIKEAEMAIGCIPRRIKREVINNIVKRLKKAKKGEDVNLSIYSPITRMGYSTVIHCLY